MLVVNDTIIGYGFGFSDTINYEQGLILTKFDSTGSLLKSNIILDTLGEPLAIDRHWGKIIPTSDGGFAMTAATAGRESAFLIKTDWDLNVEFVKEYPDTVNLSNFWYTPIETHDGYILYGSIQQPDFIIRPFARKVDKQGNTLWFNLYGDGQQDVEIFFKGQQVNDTLFVFGGVKGSLLENEDLSRAIVVYINDKGELKDSWLSGPWPDVGYIRNLKVLPDGDLLLFGQHIHEIGDNYVLLQPTLTRMTPGFDKKWVRHFGRIDRAEVRIMFLDMAFLPDGGLVGAGHGLFDVDNKSEDSGWLMKFNTDGDSIWSRYDFPAGLPVDSLLEDTFFGGVGVLSSGSIVAGGTATTWYEQTIWLVKVGADGCMEVFDCGLVPVAERAGETERKVVVYPNPASEVLNIAFSEAMNLGGEIGLYDLHGCLVLNRPIERGAKEISVNTGTVPPGFYFYEVKGYEGVLQAGKVVIEH